MNFAKWLSVVGFLTGVLVLTYLAFFGPPELPPALILRVCQNLPAGSRRIDSGRLG